MRLNAIQRVIILVGVAVFVLMGLFPPWKFVGGGWEEPARYHFIASPPEGFCKIDMSRLLIQWAVTIAASGVAVLVTAKRKDEQNS
jgi:hypothetical protein